MGDGKEEARAEKQVGEDVTTKKVDRSIAIDAVT